MLTLLFFFFFFNKQRRGWDADLLIIDEAAHIKQARVFKTAFPVATQKRSACLMLTTPGPENSYYMRLLKQVDDKGQPKLVILRFGNVRYSSGGVVYDDLTVFLTDIPFQTAL